ncbi:MAG: hypothetical protein HQL41_12690 [Alphaproteobacteria bacterium]|nr:hypothetical protein [Alphaproteobacteria bacterium]
MSAMLPFATPAIANAFHVQIAPLGLAWMLWTVWRRAGDGQPAARSCH